jgi:hypothetical protein
MFLANEPVHYELFIRRNVQAGWTLDLASESRSQIMEAAEEAMTSNRAVGVKVSKELRRVNGEYQSLVIFSRGELEPRKKGRGFEDGPSPLCVTPADLYTVHARARIGRLFEGWLRRHAVTPFELLHRPDLVEKLEATGLEIQHAIQKVAVPEAQATGQSTHDVIRRFQRLADEAAARLLADARRDVFPDLQREGVQHTLGRLGEGGDAAYLLGVAVARDLARADSWTGKVERLLDLADACGDHPRRPLLFAVLEQPLTEILGERAVLAEVVHGGADLGRDLATMSRMLLPEQAEALARRDPEVARALPPVGPEVARIARWLRDPGFANVAAALVRRVLNELQGPRRLHPDDPAAELRTLRALARLLTLSPDAVSGEEVHKAFATRSKRLVTADFVEPYLRQEGGGPLEELRALVALAENVVGATTRRALSDWLRALVMSHRFERAFRAGTDGPAHRLQQLAAAQQTLSRLGLEPECEAVLSARLGEIGGFVEADAHMIQALARGSRPAAARLSALLRLASGEAAPHGEVTRRARLEALKLARDPAARADLAQASPEELDRLRLLLQSAQAAAA